MKPLELKISISGSTAAGKSVVARHLVSFLRDMLCKYVVVYDDGRAPAKFGNRLHPKATIYTKLIVPARGKRPAAGKTRKGA